MSHPHLPIKPHPLASSASAVPSGGPSTPSNPPANPHPTSSQQACIQQPHHNVKLIPIAPLIAPKPPSANINLNISTGSIHSTLSSSKPPGIITSKQWVLPPRPKAGRKPSTSSSTTTLTNGNNNNAANTTPEVSPSSNPNLSISTRKNSVNSLSNNISNLQISNSDIAKKNELELATEENLKLKNIISRLKLEIESLKTDLSVGNNATTDLNNIDTGYGVDLSPTINPIIISQKSNATNDGKKKLKRTYKKKAKKTIVEDSPSPISLNELNQTTKVMNSDIPNIDQILNNGNTEVIIDEESVKKKKIKVPKQQKVPKKKKETKIKKELNDDNAIIQSSILTKQMMNPLDQTLLASSTNHAGIKSEKFTNNNDYSQLNFSSAFNPTLSAATLSSSIPPHSNAPPHPPSSSVFNSPAAVHHAFNSAQLSRTTTIGTLNTLDTLDTVDTLGTLDTFDDMGESSWLDSHIITNNNNHGHASIHNERIPSGNGGDDYEFFEIDEDNDLDINAFA